MPHPDTPPRAAAWPYYRCVEHQARAARPARTLAGGCTFGASPKAITNTTDYKNHGQYVKAMGGGDDAAHSCIGMPINSGK